MKKEHVLEISFGLIGTGEEFEAELMYLIGENYSGSGTFLDPKNPLRDISATFSKKKEIENAAAAISLLAEQHGVKIETTQYLY